MIKIFFFSDSNLLYWVISLKNFKNQWFNSRFYFLYNVLNDKTMLDFDITVSIHITVLYNMCSHTKFILIILALTLDTFQHPVNCAVVRECLQEQIFKLWACKEWGWEGSIVSIKSNFLSDHLLSKHAILSSSPLWAKTTPNCKINSSKKANVKQVGVAGNKDAQ